MLAIDQPDGFSNGPMRILEWVPGWVRRPERLASPTLLCVRPCLSMERPAANAAMPPPLQFGGNLFLTWRPVPRLGAAPGGKAR